MGSRKVLTKCESCEAEFPYDELQTVQEERGEFWGDPAFETVWVCPHCGSSRIYEIAECELCGSFCSENSINYGICENCFGEHRHDWQSCLKIGEDDKIECKVNSFLANIFTDDEIAKILEEKLKEIVAVQDIDCSEFIEDNDLAFAEFLKNQKEKRK